MQQRLEDFLTANNQPTSFAPITPDASTREYFRVRWDGAPAIACVYPFNDLCFGQFAACLDVTDVFLRAGLPVAPIYAFDTEKQIIVQEDFGDVILRDVLQTADAATREKYLDEAIRLIARIQAATAVAFEKNSVASRLKFDEEKLSWELDFFREHYFDSFKKSPLDSEDAAALTAEFTEITRELESSAKVLTHRDFHAANLMLQNDELKIIDYQDARIGAASYDLVSLLLDRVTVLPSPAYLAEKRAFFLAEREKIGLETLDENEFAREFRLQTIQRCLKAIGTFSFQSTFRGKTHFIEYINPMFEIVLRAAENLGRFPTLQKTVRRLL